MDPDCGDLPVGDILIEDDRIQAVAPNIDAADAEIIDARGKLVLPGMVDTHRHMWQTQMRGLCADWTLGDYFRGMRTTIAPAYAPDDVYIGNLTGAFEALNAGVTTIIDFSHCNSTPAHSDAAVQRQRILSRPSPSRGGADGSRQRAVGADGGRDPHGA